jgi:hypothetical protein
MRNSAMRQVGWFLLILLLFPFWDLRTVGATVFSSDQERPLYRPASNHKGDISKILSVLEKRTADSNLLKKAEEKLLTLSKTRAHLIASLSDRMHETAGGDNTVGNDIAFLLIAALIILS